MPRNIPAWVLLCKDDLLSDMEILGAVNIKYLPPPTSYHSLMVTFMMR